MIETINSIDEKYPATTIDLVKSGPVYFEMIKKMIESAHKELHVQMYIFRLDTFGQQVFQWLKDASSRGVHVYLLLDAFGCIELPDNFIVWCEEVGIHACFFRSLLPSSFHWGWARRLHRKVIVSDGSLAFAGGMNISDEYVGTDQTNCWLDYGIAFDGGGARRVQDLCRELWNSVDRSRSLDIETLQIPTSLLQHETNEWVAPLINNWFRGRREVYLSYLRGIQNAQQSILILCSYFLPDFRVRRFLKKATQRNVRVTLILGRRSDVPLMRRAIRSLYRGLLRSGIGIFEVQQGILHGKLAVIDGNWATVGSFNLDELSIYGNLEVNIFTMSPTFCKTLEAELTEVIQARCHPVSLSEHVEQSIVARFLDKVAFFLVRSFIRIPLFLRRRFRSPLSPLGVD